VLARLEREGLDPAPEADRVTLLRRLSLDLIGLPPTIAEVDAFLADSRDDAYERQVDRLLASPHYGERWARHWLDGARYADSDGYEKDKSRRVWFYRDWVIRAFNRDLPYDRFLVEQLAGDELPQATQEQVVATGFLRNSMVNEEGGVHPEQFRMEAMFDRMDAIGKSVLGLTIQCAQCHDHKYDPLTQREYYRLFAYLNNDHEAKVAVYSADEQRQRAELFRRIAEIEADLKHRVPDWRERMGVWETRVRQNGLAWQVVRPEVLAVSAGGSKYLLQADGSFLAQGYSPTKHAVRMTVATEARGITAFRLELLKHPDLPLGGPGRSSLGTAALTEFEVEAAPVSAPQELVKVKFRAAAADLELEEEPLAAQFHDKTDTQRVTGPLAYALDGKEETAWGTDSGPGRRNRDHEAIFVSEEPIDFTDGTQLSFVLSQRHGGWNPNDHQTHNIGRLRLSITTDPVSTPEPLPPSVWAVLDVPSAKRTPAQEATVFSYWRTTVTEWAEANERIEAAWRAHPSGSSQLTLQAREQARETSTLKRGDFLQPQERVEAGVPAFLHALPERSPPTRLTFARWVSDRNSPTTARSWVNRVWQAYFGTGLVSTSEDLGTQSEAPSHPGLLDWLAVELMDRDWSVKALQREIVTSSTYRQSSHLSEALARRDPYNRLLARGPRFRVDGEIVRDIALAASGLLDARIGGPSVYPPIPSFLLEPPVSFGSKTWGKTSGGERYRRGLYTFRYRSSPYPALQTFDVPNGEASCVRRVRSNTPLQALVTLNEPVFVECAKALARRSLEAEGLEDVERLTLAFRHALSRKPSTTELDTLLDFLRRQQRRFEAAPAEAKALVEGEAGLLEAESAGEVFDENSRGAVELAAWTALCRVLINLDETITKG